jgi:hypothetical protein
VVAIKIIQQSRIDVTNDSKRDEILVSVWPAVWVILCFEIFTIANNVTGLVWFLNSLLAKIIF